MNTEYINLNFNKYVELLNSSNPINEGHTYIWKSSVDLDLAAYNILDKHDEGMKCNKYTPLSFREITLYGYQYKEELLESPNNAKVTSVVLKAMAERKSEKENNNNPIVSLINKIYDCVNNYLSGYGFRSSVEIAKELCDLLDKVGSGTSEDLKSEKSSNSIEVPQEKEVPLKKEEQRTQEPSKDRLNDEERPVVPEKKIEVSIEPPQPNRLDSSENNGQQTTFINGVINPGLRNSIGAYKKNPNACDHRDKETIFKGMKYVDPMFGLYADTPGFYTQSIVGLMMECSGKKEIDLKCEICVQVLLDALDFCKGEMTIDLVKWLLKQSTFHVALLKSCLSQLGSKGANMTQLQKCAAIELLKCYMDKKWNTILNDQNKPVFPVNDPVLVSVMSILIDKGPEGPYNSNVEKCALWTMEQGEFDVTTFTAWMRVFMAKQSNPELAIKTAYPIRNGLIQSLIQKKGLMAELEKEDKYKEILEYSRVLKTDFERTYHS